MIPILYADNRILICCKPAGVVSTDQPGGLPDLLRGQLGAECSSLRTVHRLDQVVGGVMVLARSREAARRLSAQMEGRGFHKEYLAVLHGALEAGQGTLRDLLWRCKEERKTYVTERAGKDVQEAVLDYRVLEERENMSLTSITLRTGRTHQIRAQFSHQGHPLAGDRKYGAPEADMEGIALWSHRLAFRHPQTEKQVSFSALPPMVWPWSLFETLADGKREN